MFSESTVALLLTDDALVCMAGLVISDGWDNLWSRTFLDVTISLGLVEP